MFFGCGDGDGETRPCHRGRALVLVNVDVVLMNGFLVVGSWTRFSADTVRNQYTLPKESYAVRCCIMTLKTSLVYAT